MVSSMWEKKGGGETYMFLFIFTKKKTKDRPEKNK